MITVVESENPPLRLMLGADAYGLWKQKRQTEQVELEQWRAIGEATAFEGVEIQGIGQ